MKASVSPGKAWFQTVCLVLVGIGGGFAISRTNSTPRIEVKKGFYDFGVVNGGTDVEHDFVILNTGGRDLVISKIVTSCGCVKTAKMVDGNTIGPGKQGVLRVVWEMTPYPSTSSEGITIYCNDPSAPTKVVQIRAQSRPQFYLSSPVLNFGVLGPTELPITESLQVAGAESTNANSAISATSTNPAVKTALKKISAGKWVLSAQVAKDAPFGLLNGKVVIRSQFAPPRDIPLLGQITGDVFAEPNELVFRKVGETKKVISFRSIDSEILKVQNMDDELAKSGIEVAERRQLEPALTITLQPKAVGKSLNQNLLVKVTLSNGDTRLVRIPIAVIKP